jgi:hypothetical protein
MHRHSIYSRIVEVEQFRWVRQDGDSDVPTWVKSFLVQAIRPKGAQYISPGQSEAASAAERRPGIGESRLPQP